MAKFTYLKIILEGEAARAVDGIPITSTNYPVAISVLKEKFGRQDLIVMKLYSQLMSIAVPMNKFEELKATIDYMEQLLRQLEAQGETVNAQRMLVQQLMARFPVGFLTNLAEQRNKPCEPWSTSDLRAAMKKYLDVHATARKMADFQHEHRHNQPSSHHPRQHARPSASSLQVLAAHQSLPQRASKPLSCSYCRGPHWNDECDRHTTMDSRKARLAEEKRCFRCLRVGHAANNCLRTKDRKCVHCGRLGHNRSLCPTKFGTMTENRPYQSYSTATNVATHMASATQLHQPQSDSGSLHCNISGKNALLQTATTAVSGPNGVATVRVLLDSGSQRSFIRRSVAQSLNMPVEHGKVMRLSTVAANKPTDVPTEVVSASIAIANNQQVKMSLHTLPKVTDPFVRNAIPSADISFLQLLSSGSLADVVPTEDTQVSIDSLIGADYFWDFVHSSQNKAVLPSGLNLIPSCFGYLLTTSHLTESVQPSPRPTTVLSAVCSQIPASNYVTTTNCQKSQGLLATREYRHVGFSLHK